VVTAVLLVQIPLKFIGDINKYLGEPTTYWLAFNAVVYFITSIYFSIFCYLIGISLHRIWKGLKSNPGLKQNEKVYWMLFVVIFSYGFLFLISSIFNIVTIYRFTA